jgi:hypothetical protein
MRPLNRREGFPRRTYRPSLEGLEARDLPSVAAPLAELPRPGVGRIHALGNLHRSHPPTGRVDPALIPGFVNTLYGPVTTTAPIRIGNQVFPAGTYPVPQPTRSEIRRESFVQTFAGRYFVGPPRFSNQSSTIHIYSNGKDATSNQYLHARSQIILFTPADPTAQPTTNDPVAGQVIGLVSAFPANYLNSSSYLIMDVTNVPGVASNDPKALDRGLPSHLAWRWDPVSGGAYASPQFATNPPVQTNPVSGAPVPLIEGSLGAVANFQGTGLLDIKYIPDPRPRSGTSGSGVAIVTMQGLINTTGATYSLAKPIN